jgi:hypothetical protein
MKDYLVSSDGELPRAHRDGVQSHEIHRLKVLNKSVAEGGSFTHKTDEKITFYHLIVIHFRRSEVVSYVSSSLLLQQDLSAAANPPPVQVLTLRI